MSPRRRGGPSVPGMEWTPEIPRWRQVYVLLENRIDDGTYPPGTRLPSVHEIIQETGISRVTATRVLKELRSAGLAYMEPGIGTFVSRLPEPPTSSGR
jgi:GntR family transcriptional regulator